MEQDLNKIPPHILEKIESFNLKIGNLEGICKRKDDEIIVLKYGYESLIQEMKKLGSLKVYKNLPATQTFIPPNDPHIFNNCLKQIGSRKIWQFLDIPNLIKLRSVCKPVDLEVSPLLIEIYKKSCWFNEETKQRAIQFRNEISGSYVTAIAGITRQDLLEIKCCKIVKPLLNELFYAFFLMFGENVKKEDFGGNYFTMDANIFVSKILENSLSKLMSPLNFQKLKNHVSQNPDLLISANLFNINRAGGHMSTLLQNKIKWEDYLNENVKEERIFFNDGASEFFEKLAGKN